MKKICYVTTIPITLENFVLKSATYLHEQGEYGITFISSYDEEFEKKLPEFITYIPINMKRGVSFDGVKVICQLLKIFKLEMFDVVQYSTPNASCYASIAAYLANIKVRLYCQWGMAFVGFKGIKRFVFKTIEKMVCSLSTWIEPDSQSNLDYAHEQKLYSENKGSVIWNGSACGVDLKKFNISFKENYRKLIREMYNIPKEAYVYGFVGRITRDKGINELLMAAKEIMGNNDDIYLLMVGGKELDATVNEMLYQWSQHNKRVIYVGYTTKVEQYLSAMDCYVLPSYREGFGMGVIEAEAMGVPVIVTNIPGPIDAMVEGVTGLVIEKENSSDLKEAMLKLYRQREKGINMGLDGKEYVTMSFEQEQLFQYILEDRAKLIG